MAEPLFGTTTFIERTGIPVPRMRELEAAGVIKPMRTDRGWRAFSERDVAAVLRWKAARKPARR